MNFVPVLWMAICSFLCKAVERSSRQFITEVNWKARENWCHFFTLLVMVYISSEDIWSTLVNLLTRYYAPLPLAAAGFSRIEPSSGARKEFVVWHK